MNHVYSRHFSKFTKKFSLLGEKDKGKQLFLSFSSGIDSVVLAHLLIKCGYSERLKLIHFNHLNRKDNIYDTQFAQKFAKEYRLDLEVIKLHGITGNFESEARKKRYDYLKRVAKNNLILLGHHIDDSFEWHLMQKFKSSNLNASIGIPVKNKNIIRPLMCLTKEQIRKYAKLNNLSYINDPTNLEDYHERNFIRLNIVPLIKKKYPNYLKHYINQASALAIDTKTYLLKQRSFKMKSTKSFCEIYSFDHEGGFDSIDKKVHEAVKKLSLLGRGSVAGQIEKIKHALKSNKLGPLFLSGDLKAHIQYNHIYISPYVPSKVKIESGQYSYGQFISRICRLDSFFNLHLKVQNRRFPISKREVSYESDMQGRISAITLLRHWSKPGNRNKTLIIDC
ncbi:MAG: tRNA lysidine(34) synthetase TilS [Bacteriovoracaceae bacterium]|jgi:tRNA(Ile)-lysidine synthase|nr:tRNA lysidine(34) synthetase TilS [Bacteriovoracaceae bacterium]